MAEAVFHETGCEFGEGLDAALAQDTLHLGSHAGSAQPCERLDEPLLLPGKIQALRHRFEFGLDALLIALKQVSLLRRHVPPQCLLNPFVIVQQLGSLALPFEAALVGLKLPVQRIDVIPGTPRRMATNRVLGVIR